MTQHDLFPKPAKTGPVIYTIGASNKTAANLIERLQKNGVTLLIDVRSKPYSHYTPQFDRPILQGEIASNPWPMDYLYGGTALGGLNGLSVTSTFFIEKITRVVELAATQKVAMMCSEAVPNKCHRAYKLAAWILQHHADRAVEHILPDGSTVDAESFQTLMRHKNGAWGWHEMFPGGLHE